MIYSGGARRNRTDDLFNAIEALSQLSYGPEPFPSFKKKPDGVSFLSDGAAV